MNRENLISVIIPVYKTQEYLEKCVDSVCAQSHQNLQIILVDDGSPDDCPRICDQYASHDPRVQVIHQKNGGLSAARNAGLEAATGAWIGFVDSDDTILPQMYETLLGKALENKADLAVCGICKVNEDGEKVGCWQEEEGTFSCEEAQLFFLTKGKGAEYMCNKLFKRDLFHEIRFPVGRIYEDTFVLPHLIAKTDRMVVCSQIGYRYLQRGDAISKSLDFEKQMDGLKAKQEKAAFFAIEYPQYWPLAYAEIQETCCWLFYKWYLMGADKTQEGYGQLLRIYRENRKEKFPRNKLLLVAESLIDISPALFARIYDCYQKLGKKSRRKKPASVKKGENRLILLSDMIKAQKEEGYIKYISTLAEKIAGQDGVILADSGKAKRFFILQQLRDMIWVLFQKEKRVLIAPWRIYHSFWWIYAWILGIFGKECRFLLACQDWDVPKLGKFFQRHSKPTVYVASTDLKKQYADYPGRLIRIRAAVDLKKYHPVSEEEKMRLREKYGLPKDQKIFFHAGHLKSFRRLDWLLELPQNCTGVVAISHYFEDDMDLRKKYEERENILLFKEYFAKIEELFQASDVYIFTPVGTGSVNVPLSVPLSVFEAMACNLPVVSICHGELHEIPQGEGLVYVDGDDPKKTVEVALELLTQSPYHTREKVLDYDWKEGVEQIMRWSKEK